MGPMDHSFFPFGDYFGYNCKLGKIVKLLAFWTKNLNKKMQAKQVWINEG